MCACVTDYLRFFYFLETNVLAHIYTFAKCTTKVIAFDWFMCYLGIKPMTLTLLELAKHTCAPVTVPWCIKENAVLITKLHAKRKYTTLLFNTITLIDFKAFVWYLVKIKASLWSVCECVRFYTDVRMMHHPSSLKYSLLRRTHGKPHTTCVHIWLFSSFLKSFITVAICN